MNNNGDISKQFCPSVKIIGIGEGGIRTVNKMIQSPQENAVYSVLDLDVDSKILEKSYCELKGKLGCISKKMQREKHLNSGVWFNTNCDNEIWFNTFYDNEAWVNTFYNSPTNISLIRSMIGESSKEVIIVAGLGGTTGTFGGIWLADICNKLNIPVTVVCTIPFKFEGFKRKEKAWVAVNSLLKTILM